MTVRRRHVAIVTCVTVALLGLWLGFRFPSTAHAWPTLSDQEFWDMVVSFSEPGQAFRSLEFRPKGLHFAHVEVPPVDTDNRGRDRTLAARSAASLQQEAAAKDPDLVTIKGCVQGSHFKPSLDTARDLPAKLAKATEWTLEGNRELLKQLRREHDGHYEELTGVVIIPPSPDGTAVDVRSKDIGPKTRVTIGTAQSGAEIQRSPQTVTFRVESSRHLDKHCSSK